MGRSCQLWLEAQDKWPNLQQFIVCYLNESWPELYASPEAAVEDAIANFDHEHRKRVTREWWNWNAKVGWKEDPRRAVNDGLGANLRFRSPDDARKFMNDVYDKLIVAIRATEKGWKP